VKSLKKYSHFFSTFILGIATISDISFSQQSNFTLYEQNIFGSDAKIRMVPVNGGRFTLGSPKNEKGRNKDEGPVHDVLVDDFWMAEIEVTWDLYELFLNRTSDQAKGEKGNIQIDIDGVSGATQPYVNYNKNGYPTINITQYAASQFCKWLTAKTGNYYRLPTEAEWEYACRGGSQKAYSFGNKSKNITKYAWYNKNSDGKTHKGGQKLPNAHGLYDMHGNVAEWVLDSYSPETYIVWGKEANNPVKKNQALYPRVVRGGSYKDDLNKLRSASRGYSTHRWKQRDPQVPKSLWWHVDATHIGFRIVRPRIEPKKEDLNKMWVRPKKEY